MDFKKVGVNVFAGGSAGAVDQILQNVDEKRGLDARTAGTIGATDKLPLLKQYGTYYNYVLPALIVVGVAMDKVRGDNAVMLATLGGQLAGRKATHQFTTGPTSSTPSAAYTNWSRSAAQAAAREAAAKAAATRAPVGRTYEPNFRSAAVI